MKKQKALTAPDDPSIKMPKIRKYASPITSETQPSPQSIDSSRIYDPEFKSLDELMQLWNYAKKQNVTATQAQRKMTEIRIQFSQVNLKIKRLQENIYRKKVEHEKMTKYIEAKCETRDTIIENQNIAYNLTMMIREHTNAIIDMQEQCEKDRQHLTNLWTKVALKQQAVIKIVAQKYNDKVSTKVKELKDQFEIKCKESLSLKTACEQFEQEIKYKIQLEYKMNHKIEEYGVIIDKNRKGYNEEYVQISDTIKEKELYLAAEQETKYELQIVINANSAKEDAFLTEYKALEVSDSECERQIEHLNSTELELENENMALNKELDEMNKVHLSSILNKNLELSEYKKQLQDLTREKTEVNDKLGESIMKVQEHSKTVAKTVEENRELDNLLKNLNEELMNNHKNLNLALEKNRKLDDETQVQKEELIDVGKRMSDSKAEFQSQKAKRDVTARQEAELGIELASIEQQVFQKSEELVKLVEKTRNEEIQCSKQEQEYKNEVNKADDIIISEMKNKDDLDREIERLQSEYKEKIKVVTDLSKRCQLSGHEKKNKELNIKIDIMNKNLSNEKLRQKQEIEKRNATQTKKKEKYKTGTKKLESKYDNLEKELSNGQKESERIMSELKEAEALIEAKNSKQETTSMISTPKPILKSIIKDSPFKGQKVKFDLDPQLDVGCINVSEMFKDGERRSVAAGSANKPNWAQMKIPITVQEPDTTLALPAESQSSQTSHPSQKRKFFKGPRAQRNLTFQSVKRWV